MPLVRIGRKRWARVADKRPAEAHAGFRTQPKHCETLLKLLNHAESAETRRKTHQNALEASRRHEGVAIVLLRVCNQGAVSRMESKSNQNFAVPHERHPSTHNGGKHRHAATTADIGPPTASRCVTPHGHGVRLLLRCAAVVHMHVCVGAAAAEPRNGIANGVTVNFCRESSPVTSVLQAAHAHGRGHPSGTRPVQWGLRVPWYPCVQWAVLRCSEMHRNKDGATDTRGKLTITG